MAFYFDIHIEIHTDCISIWVDLIERTFNREGSPYLACNNRNAFLTSEKPKKYHAWSCQNVCDVLTFLLDNIFVRFGTKLNRQEVWIPMGTNCAPLVTDLFLFCYERDFMMSLSDDKQADIINAFNTTSRYLDDVLNIDNVYFDTMVSQIYHSELQLNKANTSDRSRAVLPLWIIYGISVMFVDALNCCHLQGKGCMTSWFLFVMSNCDVVTFPSVSWVRCGA